MMGGQRSGGRIAHAAFGAAAELISVQPVMTQAEADQLARARLNHRALGLIEGQGVCYGRTDLRAGAVIRIEGVGRRFSGLYYVTGAIHRYTRQRGYQTHFAVRRNAS
jgi:phage protein D